MNTEKPLRIAFVTNNYTPYSGGVVSSITSFAQELRLKGHEVIIITLDFGIDCSDSSIVQRVPCPVKFTYKKNHMAIPWRAKKYIRNIFELFKPNIVHSQHPFLLGEHAVRVAQELNIPVVFTYHTVYEDYAHYVPFPRTITRWAIEKLVTTYCSTVNLVVTPSKAIQQSLVARNVATPTAVICSGLQYAFIPQEQPEKNKNTDKHFHLLVVSRFVPEKNIKFSIDLFNQLAQLYPKKFKLTLIGYGQEFEPLKRYAYQTLALSDQDVVFIHKPEKEVIASFYRNADLFIFSSHTDVQPLALIEALAGATPIIALAGLGRAVINHGYNGFIATTVDEMLQYIIQIAQDPLLHKKLQDNAWQTAQEFLPTKTTNQLVNSYYKVLSESSKMNRL